MNIDPISTRIFYPLVITFLRLFSVIFGPFRVWGHRNIPKKDGALVLSNHPSVVDPVFIQSSCRRRMYFMTKRELFSIPILGKFISWLGAFPVRQNVADRKALLHAIKVLESGNLVVIFPEGQTSETGELQPVLRGSAWIAQRAGVPIICCGIKNTEKICAYGKFIPKPAFRLIKVRWGQPKLFAKDTPQVEIADWIQQELTRLTKD